MASSVCTLLGAKKESGVALRIPITIGEESSINRPPTQMVCGFCGCMTDAELRLTSVQSTKVMQIGGKAKQISFFFVFPERVPCILFFFLFKDDNPKNVRKFASQ
jgi:hypothetical protein